MRTIKFASLLLIALSLSCAGLLQELEQNLPTSGGSSAADGLREALAVGTGRAVTRRAQPGGYLGDKLVELAIPSKLETAADALKLIGRRDLVDEFKISLNRAAEAAAPVAKEVFMGSIRQMTFQDAMSILDGGETAATDFFRRTAGPELARRFAPIVDEKLADVGATQDFNEIMRKIEALPLVERPVFNLTEYVTDEALDGLFSTLAEEERRIRQDPLARTTDLLRRWFGER